MERASFSHGLADANQGVGCRRRADPLASAAFPAQRAPLPDPDSHPASTAADLAAIAGLFGDYAASLGIDLGAQGFEAERAALPGPYRPPSGALLLALGVDGAPLGCVALKPLDEAGVCEIKRLYVRPEARGAGLGEALVTEVLAAARAAGYAEVKLDTLAEMTAARALYRRLGFIDIPPYGTFPFPGLICLGRRL